MSSEKSGYNITVTCSQDPTITFSCRAKKRPGIRLGDKIDMTTDATVGSRTFEPSANLTIKNGSEHYFNTEEEKKYIRDWISKNLDL